MLAQGSPLLDAIVDIICLVEDDPEELSVGYGGLPNEDGVVELDAAVMDGQRHRVVRSRACEDFATCLGPHSKCSAELITRCLSARGPSSSLEPLASRRTTAHRSLAPCVARLEGISLDQGRDGSAPRSSRAIPAAALVRPFGRATPIRQTMPPCETRPLTWRFECRRQGAVHLRHDPPVRDRPRGTWPA